MKTSLAAFTSAACRFRFGQRKSASGSRRAGLRTALWLTCLSCLSAAAVPVQAGPVHANATVSVSFPADTGAGASDEVEIYASATKGFSGDDYNHQQHASLLASASSINGTIALYSSTVHEFYPGYGSDYITAEAASFATWNDTFRLTGGPAPAFFDMTYTLDGCLEAAFVGDRGVGQADVNFTGYGGGDVAFAWGSLHTSTFLGNTSTQETQLPGELRFRILRQGADQYTFTVIGRSWGRASNGFGLSDFSHTMTPFSILMPDGTTPESHGFSLAFDSGMESPNVAVSAVPEPGSMTLLSLGAIGLVGGAVRRQLRKTAA